MRESSLALPGKRAWFGGRRVTLGLLLVAGVIAAWVVRLDPRVLIADAQWHQLGKFLSAAFSPALVYEDPTPARDGVFLREIGEAIYLTLVYAAGAIGLSVIGGVAFGLAGSTRAWLGLARPVGVWRKVAWLGFTCVRAVMTLLRSVHEIVWAIVFLQALGAVPLAAVIAIAIPYSATLGKVFSELIDEASPEIAETLRANGASVVQVYVFGLLPTVFPDVLAYLFYRFECGLRSAAVLGFFGAPTLGYYLALSWGERHYHEVWAYLYALLALIVAVDTWGGVVRRRLTTRSES